MGPTIETIWTPERVAAVMEASVKIVEDAAPPDDLRVAMFTKTADLLSQVLITQQQPMPVALPNLQIPRNGRG